MEMESGRRDWRATLVSPLHPGKVSSINEAGAKSNNRRREENEPLAGSKSQK